MNEQSIINVQFWVDYLDNEGYKPVVVVAANKKDLLGTNYDKMNQVIDNFNAQSFRDVFTVSALTNEGISDIFQCVAQRCVEADNNNKKNSEQQEISNTSLNINQQKSVKKGCCK